MKKSPKKFYVKKQVKIKRPKETKKGQISSKPHLEALDFPNIFRFIPERINRTLSHLDRFTLISFVSGVLLVLFGIGLYDYQFDKNRLAISKENKDKLLNERDYWQQVVEEHKGYRDGYYMLAVSEYRLSNTDEARLNIEKALELDPLFEQGRLFRGKLQEE